MSATPPSPPSRTASPGANGTASSRPAAATDLPTVERSVPNAEPAPLYAPRLAHENEPCATCGALLAPDQRYCLSCGERRAAMRVPFPPATRAVAPAPAPALAAPAPPRRRAPLPNSAISALYGLAGAAALGLGLLAGALIVRGNDDPPAPAAAAVAATATPTPPPATPTPPPAAPATFTSDWPAGQTGWTVQLRTLPKDGTTPEAVAAAKNEATAQGAADVGALDSDQFPSLGGASYVIYSGVASSEDDARDALDGLQANFPDATVVEVSDQAPAAATPTPAAKSDADLEQEEETRTPEEAQKEIRKAPSSVESEGTPPPADDEEPGDGSDVDEIG